MIIIMNERLISVSKIPHTDVFSSRVQRVEMVKIRQGTDNSISAVV